MPPPGGEGYTALQSGAAVAEGATAAYYNPAALAELNRTTGNSVGATYSAEDLLPILDLPDLNHEFEAADIRPRFSLGRHGIYSEHTGIRNGQESWYLSFSL